jgi:hypothetical protein
VQTPPPSSLLPEMELLESPPPAADAREPQSLLGVWRSVAQSRGCLVGLEVLEATRTRLRVRLAGAAVAGSFRAETTSDDRIIYRESSFHIGSASRFTWVFEDHRLIFAYGDIACSYTRR